MYPQQNPYGQPVGYPMNGYYGGNPQQLAYQNPQAAYYPQYYPPGGHMQPAPQQPVPAPGGMFTRNLIGSLSASAFRLTDPDNKIGVWFILQDLSVRTEGIFRYVPSPSKKKKKICPPRMQLTSSSLKMNFVNVGAPSENGQPVLNHGSAPVLASVFSEPFQVFSAKKFPGVIESTPLSKCFALQGIKIPIRKDGVKGSRARAGEGEEEQDEYD